MEAIFVLVYLAIVILVMVGMFKTFKKMGYDDAWWAFIPILNLIFFLKIAEKPIWWIILFFIPLVGSIIAIYVLWLVSSKVAKAYGKGDGFAIGLLFLGFIFYPMLGFGKDEPVRTA